MPHMRYDIDSKQKQLLRNAIIKHKQILANPVEFKLVDCEEVDLLISILNNKKIRELIMNLKSKSGDKIFIIIKWFWQGDLTLWAKRKLKAEVEVFLACMTV